MRKTIFDRFCEFDRDHPRFYQLFCRFALQLIQAGHRRLSSKLIVERIRWEELTSSSDEMGFKVNNDFTPYFARKFMTDFPNHDGVFETRKVAA